MGLKDKILKPIITRVGISRITKIIKLERSFANEPDAILPSEASPHRFEIPLEMMKLMKTRDDISSKTMPSMKVMMSILSNINESVKSVSSNPENPKTETNDDFLAELKDYAESLGVGPIGYAKLSRDLVFQEMGVLYDNVIVLALEMDWDRMEKAPSPETLEMVMGTYDALGIASNKITDFLRKAGYAAQAGHPLGGLVLYPPLGHQAGIGWPGLNGLLITPEFGPRVRLTAIYTSIQNLPTSESNEHSWIEQYCDSCRVCIRRCPVEAILETPVTQDSGRVTHIDRDSCFPYFVKFFGCSVCIKVCPFNRKSYSDIKKAWESR
ncbi:MAG: 4Fe-4S dicluster domain-containing protein [Candidatus Thorarchaeota archaeon]